MRRTHDPSLGIPVYDPQPPREDERWLDVDYEAKSLEHLLAQAAPAAAVQADAGLLESTVDCDSDCGIVAKLEFSFVGRRGHVIEDFADMLDAAAKRVRQAVKGGGK